MMERGRTDPAKGVAAMKTNPAACAAYSESFRRRYPTRGIMEATIMPRNIALAMDFPYLNGFRFCKGILDMDRVSMTTNVRMVRLERRPASNTSPGNRPEKFVINATTIAAIIINALLVSSVIAFMNGNLEINIYRLSINNS
jgi:hypothetical protein